MSSLQSISTLSTENLIAVQAKLRAIQERRQARRFIDTLWLDDGPYRRELYPKHLDFFAAGKDYTERALIAANRVGKTLAGGTECSYHLTGQYPDWWIGRRFGEPTFGTAAGDTRQTTRDIIQHVLLGPRGEIGTGLIPGDAILKMEPAQGVPGACSEVAVQHVCGAVSNLSFRSYDQGRKAFQGTERHFGWPDEEPPMDVYTEMLTRCMPTSTHPGGVMFGTFTPLSGMSDVVLSFLGDAL